jgi:hypothetical protein
LDYLILPDDCESERGGRALFGGGYCWDSPR